MLTSVNNLEIEQGMLPTAAAKTYQEEAYIFLRCICYAKYRIYVNTEMQY